MRHRSCLSLCWMLLSLIVMPPPPADVRPGRRLGSSSHAIRHSAPEKGDIHFFIVYARPFVQTRRRDLWCGEWGDLSWLDCLVGK